MKTVRLYVEIAINLQRKCLGTPDCKYTENMHKFHLTKCLYQFKWDMTPCKWSKCCQYTQRTWWRTAATQYAVLYRCTIIPKTNSISEVPLSISHATCYVDLTGVCRPQGSLFYPNFRSQGSIFWLDFRSQAHYYYENWTPVPISVSPLSLTVLLFMT